MKTGDIVSGEVIDFSHEGNGVMKYQDFIVFASGGLIGDKVRVRIQEVKKNFAIGSVVEITRPSKDRVELGFPLKESRGGIPLIEYNYSRQLDWKENKVRMDLLKIAGLKGIKINKTIGMDRPFRYRNHVQIPVGEKDGRLVMGFYEQGSNNIVDMNRSILQPEIGDWIIATVRSWMNEYNIRPYDKKNNRGTIRHIGIRTNRAEEAMVILVTGAGKIANIGELIDLLREGNVISIYQNINDMDSSPVYGKEYIKLYGQDKILDHIGGYSFYLSPNSFFQTNRQQTEILYSKAIEYLDLAEDDIVYDLYSGIGTISLFLAPHVKKVYGVEIVREAVEDAWKNAELNNIGNVEFILGKAENILPELVNKGTGVNKIILDPPRKGCQGELLESILQSLAERIVYVSCNPTSLARDVKYLVENGYKLVEVQPVDMFPHSGHVECVTLMSRMEK